MNRGKFITFEGCEGTGKSTQVDILEDYLRMKGIRTLSTREPGGSLLAEDIRTAVLNHDMDSETELLLFMAARRDHIKKTIQCALTEGKWVICDRFMDTTYAYQSSARGIDTRRIKYLEDWLLEGLVPDLTILLDQDTEIGMKRANKRATLDRFELEGPEFMNKIREAYKSIVFDRPDTSYIVDANQPIGDVSEDIVKIVDNYFNLR